MCTLRLRQLAAISLLFGVGLSGCVIPKGLSLPDNLDGGNTVSAYQTVSVLLTQTAESTAVLHGSSAASTPPAPRQPSTVQQSLTPIVESSSRSTPIASPERTLATADLPCDLAAAGVPLDVTIPDDTKMRPGEAFVKTWRLVNAGSCSWTEEYALVFFSGYDLANRREDILRNDVRTGETIELSLDMIAPQTPGLFQGNYKLRGRDGNLFGIGPEGGSPFWVRIEVVAEPTVTPTHSLPTLTPTPVVHQSGTVQLDAGQSIDLDAGLTGNSPEVDLELKVEADQFIWAPVNSARVIAQGALEPDLETCRNVETFGEPLVLGPELEGTYLCARTGRGLPARIYLSRVDMALYVIEFEFITWSIP